MPLFGVSWPNVNRLRQRRDVAGLIAALTDPDDEIRRFVARALGEIKDARAVDPLIAALQDPVHSVRETAAYALGTIGDVRAADPLFQVLGTDLDLIALAAIQKVLVNIGDAQALEFLLAVQKKLASGDPRRSSVAFLVEQIQSSRRMSR
jgi:HEAT repeat protein